MQRLVLLAASAAGAMLVAAGWWGAAQVALAEQAEQEGKARAAVLGAVRAGRDALPRALEPADRALAQLQLRQTAMLRGDRREQEQLEQALMAGARRGQDGLRLLGATDAGGTLTWVSQPGLLPGWLGNQDYFLAHRYGRVAAAIGRTPLQAQGAQPGIVITRPLLGREGAFAGIGLAGLEAGRLAAVLPVTNTAADPVVALFHPDGTLIARSRGGWMSHGALRLEPGLLPEPAAAGGGERSQTRRDPSSGRLTVAAAAQVPGQELVVMALLEEPPGAAEAKRLAWLGYGLAMLGSLAVAGGLYWLSCRLRPEEGGARAEPPARPAPASLPLPRPGIGRRETAGLAQFLEAVPAALYRGRVAADGSASITAVSPWVQRLTGWPPATFLDQDSWQRLIDWGSYPPGQPLQERLLEEEEGTVEFRLRRADGSWMWLRDTARAVARREDGVEILGCLTDATRERDLAVQADTASRSAARGAMAAGLAHELHQPLAIMSLAAENALEALAEGPAGVPEAEARLRRIAAQAERAKTIAVQLRAFARLEAAVLEPVSLPAALRGAMGLVAQSLAEAGVAVESRLPPGLPAVRGQPVLVEQVLVNICLNARDALQAQPPGRRHLRILAEIGAEEDEVVLRIADSGGGIPAEILERVFDPFFTTKPAGKGTGLGLPLCRSIMTRFGGGITLSNISGGVEARLAFRRSRPGQPAQEPGGAARMAAAAG